MIKLVYACSKGSIINVRYFLIKLKIAVFFLLKEYFSNEIQSGLVIPNQKKSKNSISKFLFYVVFE